MSESTKQEDETRQYDGKDLLIFAAGGTATGVVGALISHNGIERTGAAFWLLFIPVALGVAVAVGFCIHHRRLRAGN